MDWRLRGRAAIRMRVVLLAGVGCVALSAATVAASPAEAQIVPPLDGVSIVTSPSGTSFSVGFDGVTVSTGTASSGPDTVNFAAADVGPVSIGASSFTLSTPTISLLDATEHLSAPAVTGFTALTADTTPTSDHVSALTDVSVLGADIFGALSATYTPTSSQVSESTFIDVPGIGPVGASLSQTCNNGNVTSSSSVSLGGSGGSTAAAAPAASAPAPVSAAQASGYSCPSPFTAPPPGPAPAPPPEPPPDGGVLTIELPASPVDVSAPVQAPVAPPVGGGAPPGGEVVVPPGLPIEPPPPTAGPPPLTPPVAPVAAPLVGPTPPTALGPVAPVPFLVAPAIGASPIPTQAPAILASPVPEPPAIANPAASTPSPGVATPGATPGSGSVAPTLPGRLTLTALNHDGAASGPAGVEVTLTGHGFPPRIPQGPRAFAASRSVVQASPTCETVYFFFDGVRIGSASPDTAGNVVRRGVSVPGNTGPGVHPVTASCRASGSPVLVTTEFEVTHASVHRSLFVTSLHHVEHVDYHANQLLLSAFGALALLLLIAFPAELFNTTLEEHYDEVRGWFGLRPRRGGAGTGVPNVVLFAFFLALSGPLWFAMQRSSGLDASTALAAAGLSLATAVVVLGSDLPTFLHLRRHYGEGANVVALPGSLLVAVACVALSRAVRFEPGYFYGLVGGLAFSRELRRDTTGRLAATSVVTMVGLSVVAWLLLSPVSHIAGRPHPSAWVVLVESCLGGIFWTALDSLVIALLPLRLLTGSKVVGWSRGAWATLYALTLFAFIHILLRPGTGYVADSRRSPTIVVVALFVAFAAFSFAFWGYFRFRAPRSTGEPAVPA